jgi:Uma2 family endonuclease
MSPPPFFDQVRYVARIIELSHGLLPAGKVLPETPVVTSDGVKVTNAAWISAAYAEELKGRHPAALQRTPEICIEVLSPSNTVEEIAEKSALYFDAGAREV